MSQDFFNARQALRTSHGSYTIFSLGSLEKAGLTRLERLPFSIRIMLESVLRQCNEREITQQDVTNLAGWQPRSKQRASLPFTPARVVMQDFTGVPAVVDLAAMRSAMARLGGDPKRINPLVPVDLVIDHSVQVDFFAIPDALSRNAELEFQRNRERYEFLRWGQKAFDNFRVVPPATGIVHQVNLEFLAPVVMTRVEAGELLAFPDTLVGTDSHTTMINGLGVVGWGVGGIEAEAAMLGQPIDMLTPDVIGFRLDGELREGVTATDLTLTVTQMLRNKGVVEKFVEFYGPGLASMSLPDRATIANMSPEYGATIGFFPVDEETLRYLRLTGRPAELVDLVERYFKEQGLFRTASTPDPQFTDSLELDLGTVEPSLAGPKRPQDRVPLSEVKSNFHYALSAPVNERGYELTPQQLESKATIGTNGKAVEMRHGVVVIAAITSCTNTSNPSVLVSAGLLARKAVERGLKVKSYVKTSLAPGSRVVTEYLQQAGLLEPLSELGFNVVGYGCTTCIGNSGPLPPDVVQAITGADLVAAAVLSGNRNFEGRVHPYVRANYLASPPLVVAYALAGTVEKDLVHEPVGVDAQGRPVYLREIWPTNQEVQQVIEQVVRPRMFVEKYSDVFSGNETWNAIQSGESELYGWDEASTYIQEPPFFVGLTRTAQGIGEIRGARALAVLGDSITTDHISPAGAISPDSPAGRYLVERGVAPRDYNSYGSRRGNDRVMTRGTFANIRLKNRMLPGIEGGLTLHLPDGEQMSIYEAAMKYRDEGVPLIVLGGKEYGSGSSRDWAAKGTLLLGVRAVLVESFERIHRSNLIGMGVLPLVFKPGESVDTLGLTGREVFTIEGINENITPRSEVTVSAFREDGSTLAFTAIARLETPIEVNYYRNGGILHTVLRNLIEN
ncbi:MAG: aconitate hydratase 1 [Chloroflexi bacterium RBG_16_57_11]|nr:MAG: aconitate hydratase 1 [Chloroflexi bacterium RBG_16_57_11]